MRVCLGIHLHDTLHHTDTDSCFGYKDTVSKADLCFVVYEKKGRCFSPSAQRIQVLSTSKHFIH
jgi:hypothetical protein